MTPATPWQSWKCERLAAAQPLNFGPGQNALQDRSAARQIIWTVMAGHQLACLIVKVRGGDEDPCQVVKVVICCEHAVAHELQDLRWNKWSCPAMIMTMCLIRCMISCRVHPACASDSCNYSSSSWPGRNARDSLLDFAAVRLYLMLVVSDRQTIMSRHAMMFCC